MRLEIHQFTKLTENCMIIETIIHFTMSRLPKRRLYKLVQKYMS